MPKQEQYVKCDHCGSPMKLLDALLVLPVTIGDFNAHQPLCCGCFNQAASLARRILAAKTRLTKDWNENEATKANAG